MDSNDGQPVRNRSDRESYPEYRLLENRRMRLILRYLLDESPSSVDLRTLAAFVDTEKPSDDTADDTDRRARIKMDLHHCRLPKLSAHGVIDYDPTSRTLVNRIDQGNESRLRKLLLDGTETSKNSAGTTE